jgi:hypothetical protein
LPHSPQCLELDAVLKHVPPQHTGVSPLAEQKPPAPQVTPQRPDRQTWPASQARPHWPQ